MVAKVNPQEEMVHRISDMYVELVQRLRSQMAPARPWWHVTLSKDEQLWRWLQEREKVMGWLYEAAQFLGFQSEGQLLEGLYGIFTGPSHDLIPMELQMDPRVDTLIAMVQSAGPRQAAEHIQRMEREVARRTEFAKRYMPEIPPYSMEQVPVPPPDVYQQLPVG